MPKECAVCKQPAVVAARVARGDQIANIYLCERCTHRVGTRFPIEIIESSTQSLPKGTRLPSSVQIQDQEGTTLSRPTSFQEGSPSTNHASVSSEKAENVLTVEAVSEHTKQLSHNNENHDKNMEVPMIDNYECVYAKSLRVVGVIVQILMSIIGFALLVMLFDDYEMRWLYAIASFVGCVLSGYITRLLCFCFAIITESQYKSYMKENRK